MLPGFTAMLPHTCFACVCDLVIGSLQTARLPHTLIVANCQVASRCLTPALLAELPGCASSDRIVANCQVASHLLCL